MEIEINKMNPYFRKHVLNRVLGTDLNNIGYINYNQLFRF